MSPFTSSVEGTSRSEPEIRVGYSGHASPSAAVADLRELAGQDGAGLMLVFASNRYDRLAFSNYLRQEFGTLATMGCTTAGEIGPSGYTDGGVSAIGLGSNDFVCEIGLLEGVSHVGSRACQSFAYNLRQNLAGRVARFDPRRCFALLLIDGLCCHEEVVARAINDGLGGIAMVGGSAGDGLDFRETAVLYGSRFHHDAAVLLVAFTHLPFTTFKTQHFEPDTRDFVLTGVIPERRMVTEINGLPAAEEYARAVGVRSSELTPRVFSANPMVVTIGGSNFVRSIQKRNPDGSLTFFSAIDEGLVFNLAHSLDLAQNVQALFSDIEQRIGPPRLVIGCDCILRRLEMTDTGTLEKVSGILRKYNVIGFNSYGEQFRGMHVNQTLTGIAIGDRRPQHE